MSKRMLRVSVVIVIAVIVIVYKALSVDSSKVLAFNNRLVDMVDASDSRFTSFSEHLDDYSEGKTVDVQSMSNARNTLERGVRRDRKVLAQIRITMPDDELCGEMHAAFLQYVGNSLQLVLSLITGGEALLVRGLLEGFVVGSR